MNSFEPIIYNNNNNNDNKNNNNDNKNSTSLLYNFYHRLTIYKY